MRKLFLAAVLAVGTLLFSDISSAQLKERLSEDMTYDRTGHNGRFRKAMTLFDRGLYEQAQVMFSQVAEQTGDIEAEGWAVLCKVKTLTVGYEPYAENYVNKYPQSAVVPQIRFAHAHNLFDEGKYEDASLHYQTISRHSLHRSQIPEYLFKRAYCDFEMGFYDRALIRFNEIDRQKETDYSAPARFLSGYIEYGNEDFAKAEDWFRKSVSDSRFAAMSKYYIAECRFMQKDYEWLTSEGPQLVEEVPRDCRPKLMRMISEAFLVQGDIQEAQSYYQAHSELKTRADFFYAGSLAYATEDYQGAVDNFSQMKDRTDSIGQAANYKLGYSYIKTKNKVAALGAFKDASAADYDAVVAEDAFFNYAKLAFDLNNDESVFEAYLKKYPQTGKRELIYSYIAVAALYDRDYAGAIAAYDNIDVLDRSMKGNYMKANYLRAAELIGRGSYRSAIPCLKAAAYYSDRRDMFNQMSRWWLAEAYYRDDNFSEALSQFTSLYNISALYGMDEFYLIPYNIAYCHFKAEDYESAEKWFDEYLTGDKVVMRKDALLRYADCLFMQRKYDEAATAYGSVSSGYYDVNDIYPYYQAAMSFGLAGNDNKKIGALAEVEQADPASNFYPEAMFELGRTYVRTGNTAKAEECYNRIISDVKDSTFVARSYIELGMISRNGGDYETALSHYKTVVEQLPMSGYSEDALLAIESIYRSQNEPLKYFEYVESIGKPSQKTDSEKEMMIFSAAEQIFLTDNYERALVSLQEYLDAYPQGSMVPQAYFYMAESYKGLGKADQACDFYAKVMEAGSGSYAELACLNFANLTYGLQRYEDAWKAYISLGEMAALENNKYTAKVGIMRSAYMAKLYDAAVAGAEDVLTDQRSDADMKLEADYIKAKSYLATSRRDSAYEIFARLSSQTGSEEGAEAAYLMIQDSYDRGDFDQVETRVYSFSDSGTDRKYWLAKAFIVLGDSFVERGEYEQANATFRSILDGWQPDGETDDVIENVNLRLQKLAEIMQESDK